jgi:hypothetical protein
MTPGENLHNPGEKSLGANGRCQSVEDPLLNLRVMVSSD